MLDCDACGAREWQLVRLRPSGPGAAPRGDRRSPADVVRVAGAAAGSVLLCHRCAHAIWEVFLPTVEFVSADMPPAPRDVLEHWIGARRKAGRNHPRQCPMSGVFLPTDPEPPL